MREHRNEGLCPPRGDWPRSLLGLALTLILWKFTLQLAPAREGMKRSPCLLGEDTGELAGVRVLRISETWERGGGGSAAATPRVGPSGIGAGVCR